jgi:hypothetical protein
MLAVPLAVAAVVLLIAGLAKVRDPKPTSGALRAMGLPSDLRLVRLLGAVEAVVAAAALVVDHAAFAWGIALSYSGFSIFVAAALRRGTKLQSCGCFGGLEVPPSVLHLVLDASAAAAAGVAAARGADPLLRTLEGEPGGGVPLVIAVAVAAGLCVAAITVLPMATAEARR